MKSRHVKERKKFAIVFALRNRFTVFLLCKSKNKSLQTNVFVFQSVEEKESHKSIEHFHSTEALSGLSMKLIYAFFSPEKHQLFFAPFTHAFSIRSSRKPSIHLFTNDSPANTEAQNSVFLLCASIKSDALGENFSAFFYLFLARVWFCVSSQSDLHNTPTKHNQLTFLSRRPTENDCFLLPSRLSFSHFFSFFLLPLLETHNESVKIMSQHQRRRLVP